MMRRLSTYLFTLLAAVLLGGCAVHEWPEPEQRGTMVLNLHYQPDMYVWDHTYDPMQGIIIEDHPDWGIDDEHLGTSGLYSNVRDHGMMRITVKAFSPSDIYKCLYEFVFLRDISRGYDCRLTLDIPDGSYVLCVWADLCEQESGVFDFDASDFGRVHLIHDEGYYANNEYRDAFRGRCSLTLVTPDAETWALESFDVEMRRPMAKYEFITTDLSEFLEQEGLRRNLSRVNIEDYKVEVAYAAYMPNSYDALSDRLENSTTGLRYSSEVRPRDDKDASIGFDYVMINNSQDGSSVQAVISVFDQSDVCVARSQQIRVPLRRDHHTILRGAFLTNLASGGVGIDPGYDGDYNFDY